jgi:hypothetical protein
MSHPLPSPIPLSHETQPPYTQRAQPASPPSLSLLFDLSPTYLFKLIITSVTITTLRSTPKLLLQNLHHICHYHDSSIYFQYIPSKLAITSVTIHSPQSFTLHPSIKTFITSVTITTLRSIPSQRLIKTAITSVTIHSPQSFTLHPSIKTFITSVTINAYLSTAHSFPEREKHRSPA